MGDVNELKNEIDKICKGLADKGEESIFVTVSLEKTTCFVMGSDIGLHWLDSQSVMVQKFFQFCADQYQLKEVKKEKEDDFGFEAHSKVKAVDTVVEKSTDFLNDHRFGNENDACHSMQTETSDIRNQNLPAKTNQALSSNQGLDMALPTLPTVSTKTKSPTKLQQTTIHKTSPHKSTNQRNSEFDTIEIGPTKVPNNADDIPHHSSTSDNWTSLMNVTSEISPPMFSSKVPSPKKQQAKNDTKRPTSKKRKNQSLDKAVKKYKTNTASNSPLNNALRNMSSKKLTDQKNLHTSQTEDFPNSELNGGHELLGESLLNSVPSTEGEQNFTNLRRSSRRKQNETEEIRNESLNDGDRLKRKPVPRKLHHMECFVKLRDLKGEELVQEAIIDDPTLNRSEVTEEWNETVHHNGSMASEGGMDETNIDLSCDEQNIDDDDDDDDESFVPFEVGGSGDEEDEDDDDYDYNEDAEEIGDDDEISGDSDDTETKRKPDKMKFDKEKIMKNYATRHSRKLRKYEKTDGKFNCEACGAKFMSKHGYKCHKVSCGVVRCVQCDQRFESIDELIVHAKTHEGEDMHRCEFCDKSFSAISTLKRHETMVHRKKNYQFQCPHCPKKFFTGTFVRAHLKDAHTELRHICLACNQFFDTKFDYNVHMNEHRQTKINAFLCKKCGKSFELLYYLKRHNRWFHKAKGERICKLCLNYFPNDETYKEHLKEHEWDKPNTCSFCRESFGSKELLNEHVRNVHNKGIMYICEICGFEADHSLSLKHHKMEHEENMPYTCGQCGKGFPLKHRLREHMINHTDDLPFVCETCGKRFKRRTTLRSHMIVHSEGKTCKFCNRVFRSVGGLDYHTVRKHAHLVNTDNFKKTLHKCEECNMFFPSKHNYDNHMVKHSDARMWQCGTCDKRFKTEQQKLRHEDNHLSTKPFYCDRCDRSFTSKPRWEAHIKTEKHKINSTKSIDDLEFEKQNRRRQRVLRGAKQRASNVNQQAGINSQNISVIENNQSISTTEDSLDQSVSTTEENFDQSASATMIDLPETTILVIGDYHGVGLVSDETTGEEIPVQYIQTLQAECQ